jgi:hypothetical protein
MITNEHCVGAGYVEGLMMAVIVAKIILPPFVFDGRNVFCKEESK